MPETLSLVDKGSVMHPIYVYEYKYSFIRENSLQVSLQALVGLLLTNFGRISVTELPLTTKLKPFGNEICRRRLRLPLWDCSGTRALPESSLA